jgi:hypothetical protein
VCKKDIFAPKYKEERENGMMHADVHDDKRFWFVDTCTEIVPGVFVFPEIKITDKVDTHFERFFVEVDGENSNEFVTPSYRRSITESFTSSKSPHTELNFSTYESSFILSLLS